MNSFSLKVVATALPAMLLLLHSSCADEAPRSAEQQLVIEGYIDLNGFPVVMVTTSVAVQTGFSEPLDSLDSHMLRWARVAVSDGEQQVVLTGMVDRSYFPPYVYTTSRMRGQAGKDYTLTVDYAGYHATAVAHLPEAPAVDSMWVKPVVPDSLCSIVVSFADAADQRNYYKAFVRRGRRGRQWLPAYLGTVSDAVLGSGSSQLVVNKAGMLTDSGDYVPYFSYSDTVTVKFAQIDETAYRFWSDFDNSTNFARNPLFPVTASLRGNVQGGLGCWYGCGAVTRSFVLDDYR